MNNWKFFIPLQQQLFLESINELCDVFVKISVITWWKNIDWRSLAIDGALCVIVESINKFISYHTKNFVPLHFIALSYFASDLFLVTFSHFWSIYWQLLATRNTLMNIAVKESKYGSQWLLLLYWVNRDIAVDILEIIVRLGIAVEDDSNCIPQTIEIMAYGWKLQFNNI